MYIYGEWRSKTNNCRYWQDSNLHWFWDTHINELFFGGTDSDDL